MAFLRTAFDLFRRRALISRWVVQDQVPLYQSYFERMLRAVDLNELSASVPLWNNSSLGTAFLRCFSSLDAIVKEAVDKHDLRWAVLGFLFDSYIEAKPAIRQLHRNAWVEVVLRRPADTGLSRDSEKRLLQRMMNEFALAQIRGAEGP